MIGKLGQTKAIFSIVLISLLCCSSIAQAVSPLKSFKTAIGSNIVKTVPSNDNLVLWNKLGSKQEVENSIVGLNGTIKGGNFITGVFGGAYIATHNENALVTFPKEVIPVTAGTIELWARLIDVPNDIPEGESPNLFKFQDSHGNNFAILFAPNDGEGNGGLTARAGHYFTAGTGWYGSWTYQDALKGGDVTEWHHYALVWNKDGIAGIADGAKKVAIFLDGQLNSTRWHVGEPGEFSPLVGGALGLLDQNGHFDQGSAAFDNLKIWNYAKTDFSDRFVEDSTDVEGKANIVIAKEAIPDSPRNFHYHGAWGEFYLDDPGEDDGDTIKNSMRYTEVTTPGTYSISEEKIANWFLDEIICTPSANVTINKLQHSVTLQPQADEHIVCSFINKYASSLSVSSYWDMDQDGQHDPAEAWQNGWWTEFYDSNGTLNASNFTQNGGHWDLYNIRPGTYTVCQKPQDGWYSTRPIITEPTHNWPCYTFDLSYAQQAKLYFGYHNEPFVKSANEQSTLGGVEINNVSDREQDALATWKEFLAVHPGDRLPDEDEMKSDLFLPMLTR